MNLDFPAAPGTGLVHIAAGLSWRFDGTKWMATTTGEAGSVLGATIVVTAGQVLPAGFDGTVLVEAAAPLIVTLPSAPTVGQAVTIKDAAGNAGTYPITVSGGGALIEGMPTLVINFNYGWAALLFSGGGWVQV